MKKIFSLLILISLFIMLPGMASATAETSDADIDEVTISDLGLEANTTDINTATAEDTFTTEETGTLIEIGNTTAAETTVIVRVTDDQGATADQTVEIDLEDTDLVTNDGTESDLSDWIAGDTLTYTAEQNTNSGSIQASKIKNRALRRTHLGKNGWITAIRADVQEVDVTWQNQTFTLDLTSAKIVAGVKNPATITDLKVGDRVRSRVIDDGDQNPATWDAKILVVLRRGNSLFMRVTRWVVPVKIVELDEEPVLPTTIKVEVLANRFYQAGDVNNLIGKPGDTLNVYIDAQTKLRRKFLGNCLITELSEGDQLQIIGRLNETTGNLDAKQIRNISIQKLGVARQIATVKAVIAEKGQIIVTSKQLARSWQINVSASTKIYKQGAEITLADIQAGDKLRVFGTANRTKKIVTAQKIAVLR